MVPDISGILKQQNNGNPPTQEQIQKQLQMITQRFSESSSCGPSCQNDQEADKGRCCSNTYRSCGKHHEKSEKQNASSCFAFLSCIHHVSTSGSRKSVRKVGTWDSRVLDADTCSIPPLRQRSDLYTRTRGCRVQFKFCWVVV